MTGPFDVTMFGMARYDDWVAGVSNRQLELLDVLQQHPDARTVLAVDILPWRGRDVIKSAWYIARQRFGHPVSGFGRPWRSLRQVSPTLYVLSSAAAINGIPNAQFKRDVDAARRLLNLRDSLVWSYVPTLGNYLNQLPRRKLLFDAVDNWLTHPFYGAKSVALRAGYAAYEQAADVITTVNPSNARLFPSRHDVVHVPNGVAASRYSEQHPVPSDIASLPRPIIGYVGTIQGRLDTSIIEHLSANMGKGSIVLIGPVWYRGLEQRLARLSNVYLLGRKTRWATPAYVQHFDVGIVPHRSSPFLASTEAMKVYEYLAAGLPIVATPGAGSSATARFIHEASSPADFTAAVLAASSNQVVDKGERHATAQAADWSARLDAILNLV